jgi:ribosomal protein S18 acetylase RimI-like enzyme
MKRIHSVAEIFHAIQQAKTNAPAFRTNFFPVEEKLQSGLDRGEWLGASGAATALFLRQDRDFWHLYFSAASVAALQIDLAACVELKAKPVTVDLVGRDIAVQELSAVFESAGFRSRARLLRLVRMGQPAFGTAVTDRRVALADPIDCPAIVDLLLRSFDRYAEQIPELHELEAAVRKQQVLLVKDGHKAIAVLYFEAHGVTSHIRYWLVDEAFRAAGYGSALMRHYAALQSKAQRLILWVLANNEETLRKYRHYGYAPDGLVDHVLANSLIDPPSETVP